VTKIFTRIGDSASTLNLRTDKDIAQATRQKDLRPGDKLPAETNLCATPGLGRITLRDALRRLHAQGLFDAR